MSESVRNQFALLRERRFLPFFATQFLGALNDNVLRNGLVFLVTYQAVSIAALEPALLVNLSAGLFILPFFLFSALAGQLADKYDKAMLIRRIKLAEIGLALVAVVAILTGQAAALLTLVFLMGLQSALFGPVKYSILPQALTEAEIVGGNGLVEGGTYIAIILGLMIGGVAGTSGGSGPIFLSLALVVFATAGYAAARYIPEAPPPEPDLTVRWNPLRETARIMRFAASERSVLLSILGISWFWSFGFVALSELPVYTAEILRGDAGVATLLLGAFAVGIAIGALLCERLSVRRIELGLVPIGSLGLTVFALDVYFARPVAAEAGLAGITELLARPGSLRIFIDFLLLGASGALFSVPLYALIQERSEIAVRSRIIAANNVINALFMVLASALALAALAMGLSLPGLFLALAILNAAVALYLYTLLPEFVLRLVAWVLVHVMYRVRAQGLDNIPDRGAAVLVCNHVSYVDALIIGGLIRRPVRFVMYYRIFEVPVFSFLFRAARAIPIASHREDERLLEEAYDAIDEELASGNLICIFPEGALTRDGRIHRFRPGVERILARRPVPAVPMALSGLWDSWFSRQGGRAFTKLPRRFRARVDLRVGKAIPAAQATARDLEMLVRTLRGPDR
ncbi:MAG: MFS transporter [Gammaproteobacteria bacterium]